MLYYPFTAYRLWWKEFLGINLKHVMFYWNGEYYESWRDDVEIDKFYNYLKKLCDDDKNLLDSWIDQVAKNNTILDEQINTVLSLDLESFSDQELIHLLKKTNDVVKSYWIVYTLPLFASEKVEFSSSQKEKFLPLRKKTLYVDFQVKLLPKLFSEISKRTGVDENLLYFAFPDEVIDAFEKKISVDELRKRKENWFWKNEDGKLEFLSGKKAQRKYDEMFSSKQLSDKTLKGVGVSKGKAKGKAKVIVTEQSFEKLGDNDILVTLMVRPTFYSKIKACRAIITEEGGINSHAAILARELNIPCIVQVENATKNIVNGESLEVDANEGVVRRRH